MIGLLKLIYHHQLICLIGGNSCFFPRTSFELYFASLHNSEEVGFFLPLKGHQECQRKGVFVEVTFTPPGV